MADHGKLTYEVVGAAMRVHNSLGPGLREKPYENALAVELRETGIPFSQQQAFPIFHRNVIVGDCIPDLTISNQLLVEIKSTDSISDKEEAQMLNYLRVSGMELGLILNFRNPRMESKRMVRSVTS